MKRHEFHLRFVAWGGRGRGENSGSDSIKRYNPVGILTGKERDIKLNYQRWRRQARARRRDGKIVHYFDSGTGRLFSNMKLVFFWFVSCLLFQRRNGIRRNGVENCNLGEIYLSSGKPRVPKIGQTTVSWPRRANEMVCIRGENVLGRDVGLSPK